MFFSNPISQLAALQMLMTHPTVTHSTLLQAHSTAQEKLFRPATGKSSLGFHKGLVMDEVALGQIFLLGTPFCFSTLLRHSPNYTLFIHH